MLNETKYLLYSCTYFDSVIMSLKYLLCGAVGFTLARVFSIVSRFHRFITNPFLHSYISMYFI